MHERFPSFKKNFCGKKSIYFGNNQNQTKNMETNQAQLLQSNNNSYFPSSNSIMSRKNNNNVILQKSKENQGGSILL